MSHGPSRKFTIRFGSIKRTPDSNGIFVPSKVGPREFSLGEVCPDPATWAILGPPWPDLVDAISNLDDDPQTVTFTYSFMLAGVTMDPGTSVVLEDKFGGPNNAQFKSEVDASLNEWKTLFETLFSRNNGYKNNLTLNFVDLGDETGTSVDSNPSFPSYTLPHADNIGHFRFGMHNIDGAGNIVAHAYSPEFISGQSNVGGDVHFDSSDLWRLDSANTPGAISIKMVCSHEIGHAFGLGHDTNPFALMFPTVSSLQKFDVKWPEGLVNGHVGAGSSGLSDACGIASLYAPQPVLPTLPGLALHLDATDVATIAVGSGANDVTVWADKSGNSRDFIQPSGPSRPIWQSTGINSRPAIRFSGAEHLIHTSNLLSGTQGEVFAVFTVNSASVATLLCLSNAGNSLGPLNIIRGWHNFSGNMGPAIFHRPNNSVGDKEMVGTTTTIDTSGATPYYMNWRSDGSTYDIRVNSVDQSIFPGAGFNNGDWWGDNNTAVNTHSIGVILLSGGPIQFFDGFLGELIVYDGVTLSSSDRAIVENYLINKWGF